MASTVFLTLAIVLVISHGHVLPLMGQETPTDLKNAGALDATFLTVAGNGAAAASGFTEDKGWFFQRPLARPTPLPPSLKL